MCPWLDQTDSRCSQHLSLHSLDDALGQCANAYAECPIYRQKVLAYAAQASIVNEDALAVAG